MFAVQTCKSLRVICCLTLAFGSTVISIVIWLLWLFLEISCFLFANFKCALNSQSKMNQIREFLVSLIITLTFIGNMISLMIL